MSVIAQYTPYELRDGTWEERREELGDLVLRTLEEVRARHQRPRHRAAGPQPLDLERDYGLTGGHPITRSQGLTSGSCGGRCWVTHGIGSPWGLYLAGAGAHPGGGVTGQPGQNAAREILSDWKGRRS